MNLRILPLYCVLLLACAACSKADEKVVETPAPVLPKPEETVLTYDNFNRLKTGMTEDQVRQVLGKPTVIDAQIVKDNDRRVIYTYHNDAQTSAITINFVNGGLDSKSCDLTEPPKPLAPGVVPSHP